MSYRSWDLNAAAPLPRTVLRRRTPLGPVTSPPKTTKARNENKLAPSTVPHPKGWADKSFEFLRGADRVHAAAGRERHSGRRRRPTIGSPQGNGRCLETYSITSNRN